MMEEYRMDIEKNLRQSLVNNARLQHIVSRIDADRNKSATKNPAKKFYLVAAIIIVVLIPVVISFNPTVSNILSSSDTEIKTPTKVPPLAFSIDAVGNYTGFSNLPKNYTVEDAKKDGYIVEQDSVVIANIDIWADFVETAEKGNNTSVRMVRFSTQDLSGPYFRDLFFNDGYYSLFDSSSDKQAIKRFSYLLALEGQAGSPLKDNRVVVLTNDNTLSFNVVMKSLSSSSMEYMRSVPPYRLVLFNVSV
jgi:hypothetical protein